MHGVRREIVMLTLFAVGNDRRARGLEPLDGVSNGNFVERSEVGILAVGFGDSLDEIGGSWDNAQPPAGATRTKGGPAPPFCALPAGLSAVRWFPCRAGPRKRREGRLASE